MQKLTKRPSWHQLDPDVGGYMSCHVGSGLTLVVLTTVISTKSREEHKNELMEKVERLNLKADYD